jgi:enoyl-CoA hydratase/carnithine racemase
MANNDELLVEMRDRVALLTLNRPERRNALSSTLLASLSEALRELTAGRQARCVVLRGAGQKAFSAGMDLAALPEDAPADIRAQIEANGPLARCLDAIEESPLPFIAMIRGWCLGAGCETSMSCDLRVGSENCRMGMPPARLGIVYPPGGLQRFLRAVGPASTRKIFFSARYFDAGEALRTGMLHYVVPDAELEDFTMRLAGDIATNAPLSMSGHKRSLYHLTRPAPLPAEAEAEINELTARAFSSEDAREGLTAFAQKRDPVFKGE